MVTVGGFSTSYPAPPFANVISAMPPFSSNDNTVAAAPMPVLSWLGLFSLNITCKFAGLVNPAPAFSIQILVTGAFVFVTGVPPTKRNLSPTL